jgi:hypothetical protein
MPLYKNGGSIAAEWVDPWTVRASAREMNTYVADAKCNYPMRKVIAGAEIQSHDQNFIFPIRF